MLDKFGLGLAEGAQGAVMSTGFLIQKCVAVLTPEIGYAIAANGMLEAAKTVPIMAPVG